MPLDPRLQAARDQRVRDRVAPLYTMSVAQARAADLAAIQASSGMPEPVHEVTDLTIPGPASALPVRVYRPSAEPGLPVLVYYFGGGWTLGSLDTGDGVCRALCNAAGCVVVGVGYRLAPESKFPAAVQDCYAGLVWTAATTAAHGGDPTRIAVGGDSAGGNLAAVVALMARDGGAVRVAGQLLVYPNTDYLAETPSLRENTDEAMFNRTSVSWYWNNYLGTAEDGSDPLASPLRASDHSGLPPALVITAEFDPLRDEGELYAERLAKAGNEVTLSRYDGMAHGFFTMTGALDAADRALAEAAAALRSWFAGP